LGLVPKESHCTIIILAAFYFKSLLKVLVWR